MESRLRAQLMDLSFQDVAGYYSEILDVKGHPIGHNRAIRASINDAIDGVCRFTMQEGTFLKDGKITYFFSPNVVSSLSESLDKNFRKVQL